jgi:uncharacterized membrane protein
MAVEIKIGKASEEKNVQEFTQEDINQNKVMAIFAYIGPMVFIPMFAAKQSKFAHYHTVQGFTLFILEAIVGTLSGILSVSALFWLGWLTYLIMIPLVIFSVLGIVSAAKGEARVLPIVGGIKIIK